MRLDPKLRSILTPAPIPAAPVPRPGAWRSFWQQPSQAVAIEVALVVVVVMVCTRPPPSRWVTVPPPVDVVHVRTRLGDTWVCRATEAGVGAPERVTASPQAGVPALLMQDPYTRDILALDASSGAVCGHLASTLLATLLPGRDYGVGSDGHRLFRVLPQSLRAIPTFQSDARVGDVAPLQDGTGGYVSFPDDNAIAVLDRNHRVQGTVQVEGSPTLLSLQRHDSELWAVCGRRLKIMSLANGLPETPRAVVPLADDVVGILPEGDRVYAVGQHTVTMLDTAGQVLQQTPCPAADPVGWGWSASSHALVVAASTPPSIEVLTSHVESMRLSDSPTFLWVTP